MTLAIRPPHAALLSVIRQAPGSPRVVVIGAVAISHHLRLGRETGDVDLAIVAEEPVVTAILTETDWERDERVKQRWRHEESGSVVDVLPATPRILLDGHVRLDGDDRVMSMIGFDLALAHTATVALDPGPHSVEVATLPALAMLKMVAWLDRPYDRIKDLGDLARILDDSLGDWDERRWSEPFEAFADEDQSAFFAGCQLASILDDHHSPKIDEFFARMETEAWLAVMARQGRWVGADPEAIARRRLTAFRAGLAERSSS